MAIVDDDVVLLDARHDRYACLAAGDAASIRAQVAVRLWDDGPLVRELAMAGYLRSTTQAPAQRPTCPAKPGRDLHMIASAPARPRHGDLFTSALAGLVTAVRLRLQCPRHWLRRAGERDDGEEQAIGLARRFDHASLYLPGLTRCLPRSLALLDFLHRHGSTAQLVFGVRTHPFEAHCWVQSGDVVLNDTLTRASWYTPIAWS